MAFLKGDSGKQGWSEHMPHGAARVQKKQCGTVEAMEEHA